jgi:uncharacterized membrane protein HdeD (DUF308 family)
MNSILNFIYLITTNQYIHFTMGIILILSGGNEIVANFGEESSLSTHHGVFAYGILHTLKAVHEILKGLLSTDEVLLRRMQQQPAE